MDNIKSVKKEAKKALFKIGCAGTFFQIINKEYGNPNQLEEYAAGSLCGGIMLKGYQCGMLWGAVLGIGTEAYNRFKDKNEAADKAITASKHIANSFMKKVKKINCHEITSCDWSKPLSIVKYFLTGKSVSCSRLTQDWAPEAIYASAEGLSLETKKTLNPSLNCASEVAKKMGATDKQIITVAGFAGGIGLTGNGCGALGAAIWLKSIEWYKKNPEKFMMQIPDAKKILEAFTRETNSEFLCSKICGKKFQTIEEHTEYIKNSGCSKLTDILAES